MTIEELKNTYEFKLVKKIIMREYPFVKDITVKEESDINRWTYIMYLEFVIDPFILSNMLQIPVWYLTVERLKRGEPHWSTSLTLFFAGTNEDKLNVIRNVNKQMENLMKEIHETPAIPKELKLDKVFNIGSYVAYPDSLPPFYDITSDNYEV